MSNCPGRKEDIDLGSVLGRATHVWHPDGCPDDKEEMAVEEKK